MNTCSILHVTETLKGGIASYLEEILPIQVSKFGTNNVHILAPSDQLPELPNVLGLDIQSFNAKGVRFWHVIQLIFAIRRILRTSNISVVHSHSTFAGLAARIALRMLNKSPKLVYCAHGWAFDRKSTIWKNVLIGKLELFLSRWTDKIICISDHDHRSALTVGIPIDRLVTIPNAISVDINLEGKISWPDGKFRFLFVGRFDKQKGVDLFIDSMRELGDNAFAYIVGSPVVAEEKIDVLPSNIKITGWLPRDKVQAYIASAQVVVIPSRWEGFGLTAIEAMRANRPVIAARVGGLVDIIVDNETGFLVDPNSVPSLLSKMSECVSGSVNLTKLGLAARKRFEQFYTSDRLNRDLFTLYSSILDE